jgi:Tol biopolymer transport system component
LNREVALKVLPESFAADPERLARFEREAQTLAGLNHPHIATIYGIEEKEGVRALVLELVEGHTLAELIARGPIPPDQAVGLARQIADALEAAHEQGVVHRDLKPANVKVTPDGVVKVLDFGLAKLTSTTDISGGSAPSLSMSPTMTSPALLTGATVLMGTAGYMAPEQARGKAIDKRADIWAFGVVLYEMLTGRRAFAGESVTEVAGAVIHTEPDWNAVPAASSGALRMILHRCLQKDPKQRFRDMGDVRLALDGAFAIADAPAPTAVTSVRSRRPGLIPLAAGAIAVALAAATAVWVLTRQQPVSRAPMRFTVAPPELGSLSPLIDISPDGRMVSFIALDSTRQPRVWVRPLDSFESRIVAPGELTRLPTFWSPDSRYLVMFADGKLKKVAVAGGPPETIAEVKGFAGGTWGSTGIIVFSTGTSLMRVPATGGTPVEILKQVGANVPLLPVMLPDGQHFLYLHITRGDNRSGIYVRSVDARSDQQDTARLVPAGHNAAYAPSPDGGRGHLIFVRDGLAMAQEFDERTRTLVGEPVRIVDDLVETNGQLAAFAVSGNGTFVYRRTGAAASTLSMLDRNGRFMPLPEALKVEGHNPRVSPDGRRLAVVISGQVWVYDLEGRPPIRLTSEGEHYSPIWTPDGRSIVFEKNGSDRSLFMAPADGSAAAGPIGPQGHYHPYGWVADGREIVAVRMPAPTVSGSSPDLVRFGTGQDTQVQEILATPASEGASGHVSPDGRWIAYSADTTGRQEIWVRPTTGVGAAIRVSPDGGFEPIWSRDGRELFYVNERSMMAVPVETGSTFNFKPPVTLFTATIDRRNQPPAYDVTPDGRFVAFASAAAPIQPISVIVHWTELQNGRAVTH